ncbi:MAG: amidohydrolase family protein [Nitrospirae bacterium]|nr:amidohydrolase family protein [Nitrospirota bacterium]
MIKAVGTADRITQRFPRHRIIHLQNTILMPGLINSHTHLELPDLLNKIRTSEFADWILNLIRLKKRLTILDYETATKENIRTLIRTGTTTVGEICTHDVSPALIRTSGLRAMVFHEIIKMGSGVRGQGAGIQLSRRADSALIKYGLSPHTPYTVSESVLRDMTILANKKHLQIAMHVAESKDETKLLRRNKSSLEKLYKLASWDLDWAPEGSSSFEFLKRIGFLSSRLLAVHAVQVTDKDIELIRKSKVSIAHCPRSNKETGVGRMPLKKILNAGITVGLGTDSLASSPSLGMWDEMRFAYHLHRRDGITAKEIFDLATIGGAKALGLNKVIGTLEPGKKADIIAVPIPKKNTGDLYSDLLRETKSCTMTMVNGKILHKIW